MYFNLHMYALKQRLSQLWLGIYIQPSLDLNQHNKLNPFSKFLTYFLSQDQLDWICLKSIFYSNPKWGWRNLNISNIQWSNPTIIYDKTVSFYIVYSIIFYTELDNSICLEGDMILSSTMLWLFQLSFRRQNSSMYPA